jgi:integrase
MASIAKETNGHRRIQFVTPDGSRKTVRLGKIDQRSAETICRHVETLLASKITAQPVGRETATWVAGIGAPLREKLAKVGLVETIEPKPSAKLAPFLREWLDRRRRDYKPATVAVWEQSATSMINFFGADISLEKITSRSADDFRLSLAKTLAPTTVHKRIQHARLFCADAKRQRLIDENPFEFCRPRTGGASKPRPYIPQADILRVIEFAPNTHWRLLIALSRFAGLRVPSEALSLRWQDVDWERSRLTVTSPKTAHLPGRGYRVIPLFPVVRTILETAWDEAPEKAEFIFPDEYRRRAQKKMGWANANFRTTLEKIVRRAGIEPWRCLWHSMRANCETDLARHFPLSSVCKWLGNTQAVAMRHYVDVTDADFNRAATFVPTDDEKTAQNPAQYLH